jgi:antitoxin HicB
MEFYFEHRRPVPAPWLAELGQHCVEISPSLSAKILLLNETLAQNLRPAV